MLIGEKGRERGLLRIVDLLNLALGLELTLCHWCEHASQQASNEGAKLLRELRDRSKQHEVMVRDAIRQMGGEPMEQFETPDPKIPLRQLLEQQLEREKLARYVYGEASRLAPSQELKNRMAQIENDEKAHITIVERILASL